MSSIWVSVVCWACPGPTHTLCVQCGRGLCERHEYADPAPRTLWLIKRLEGKLCKSCHQEAQALAIWSVRPLVG